MKQELEIKSQLKITTILKNYTNTIREEEKMNWWIGDHQESPKAPIYTNANFLIIKMAQMKIKFSTFQIIAIFQFPPNFPFNFQFVAAEKRKAGSWKARRLQLGFSSGLGFSLFFFLISSSSILAQSTRFSSQNYFLQNQINKQIKFINNLDYEQKLSH